jgi:hypothetical protein
VIILGFAPCLFRFVGEEHFERIAFETGKCLNRHALCLKDALGGGLHHNCIVLHVHVDCAALVKAKSLAHVEWENQSAIGSDFYLIAHALLLP